MSGQQIVFKVSEIEGQPGQERPRMVPFKDGMRPAGPDEPNDPATIVDLLIGALKGIGRTGVGLGRLINPEGIPQAAESALGLDPSNRGQQAGMTIEQGAEFFLPGGAPRTAAVKMASHLPALGRAAPIVSRMATEAAPAAVIAAGQGGNPAVAGTLGAVGGVAPPALKAAGSYIGSKAEPLVRAAIKPTVAAAKKVAGASQTGIEAQAKRLTKFILENSITTAEQADRIIKDSERTLRALFATGDAVTDAPQRAARYLNALERSAAKQNLPVEDVATIRAAAQEMLESSGLAETKTRTVMRDSPSGLVDASGRRVQTPVEEPYRELRTDVMASEALERARANSRWDTKKQWGEQKSAKVEASKAIERAERDAVKDAVPGARPILQRESQAIQAREALDRMEFRQANRDAVSLPSHVVGAGEIAAGRVPVMAFAANWLRNNQMKAGVWAHRLDRAIKRNDVDTVVTILDRLGVSAAQQPATAR